MFIHALVEVLDIENGSIAEMGSILHLQAKSQDDKQRRHDLGYPKHNRKHL